MRSVGVFLSLLCGMIAIGLLWAGYVGVFEETQVTPDFESTPREGWAYWMRLEFWHDLRAYGLWILLAIGGLFVPALGVIRSVTSISSRKIVDWSLFGISVLYFVLWSWGLVQALRRPDPDWVLIPPFILIAGCCYGLLVFWKRARYRLNEEAQQDAPSNR